MKKRIEIEKWERKELYRFFSQFEEPFFGITVRIDCTKAYSAAKAFGKSFFLHYLYRALKAANEIENFRYRVFEKEVYLFDKVNASPTINRENGTFGFAYMDYEENEEKFIINALKEIERVQKTNDLLPAVSGENVIHFSAVPWIDFTALSHARSFTFPDSSPKISFGKVTEEHGLKTMAVSLHAHHGLMDGIHAGQFIDRFQELMDEN